MYLCHAFAAFCLSHIIVLYYGIKVAWAGSSLYFTSLPKIWFAAVYVAWPVLPALPWVFSSSKNGEVEGGVEESLQKAIGYR